MLESRVLYFQKKRVLLEDSSNIMNTMMKIRSHLPEMEASPPSEEPVILIN